MEMILELKKTADQGNQYTLMELVGPKYYDRPIPAVYTHGGPLVAYLIERYGPETFFKLYRDVRQPTFLKESERILGDSWASVEIDFWQWLDAEAASYGLVTEPSLTSGTIVLSDEVNPDEWQTVRDAYSKSRSRMSNWPRHFAIKAEYSQDEKLKFLTEVIRDNDEIWARSRDFDSKITDFVAATPEHRIALFRENDGIQRLAESGDTSNIEEYVSRYVQSIPSTLLGMAELGRILPLDEGERFNHARIKSFEKIDERHTLWRLRCEVGHADRPVKTFEILLDSALDWNVRRYTCWRPDNTEQTAEFDFAEFLGHAIAIKRTVTGPDGEHSEQVVGLLDKSDVEDVRVAVNAAARKGPTPEPMSLSEVILRPLHLAIAWPVCGLSLWLVSRKRRSKGADN